ncbi:hypothetical protein [Escherichia coli]|uniref:hypothetical protein n=1 Tax=Escherichia coli TaxID=562 RepID=UPI00288AD59C|nr:hypothetical protein [Escherichia coli]
MTDILQLCSWHLFFTELISVLILASSLLLIMLLIFCTDMPFLSAIAHTAASYEELAAMDITLLHSNTAPSAISDADEAGLV